MRLHRSPLALLLTVLLLPISCSVNPFDQNQVPIIGIQQEGELMINWTPGGARDVRVLKGRVDPKDPKQTRPPSQNVMWSIGMQEQPVRSPVTYGKKQEGTWASEAQPLVSGETYTVYVLRDDPKGSGDGFTNTRNVYEAVAVFVMR